MCLRITEGKIRPEKDIVCYKVLMVRDFNARTGEIKKLVSPYQIQCQWTVGKRKHVEGIAYPDRYEKDAPIYLYPDDDAPVVQGGAFHTLADIEDAKRMARDLDGNGKIIALYKCIIPKDSDYIYKGIDDNGFASYASSDLIVKEKVPYSVLWMDGLGVQLYII